MNKCINGSLSVENSYTNGIEKVMFKLSLIFSVDVGTSLHR